MGSEDEQAINCKSNDSVIDMLLQLMVEDCRKHFEAIEQVLRRRREERARGL